MQEKQKSRLLVVVLACVILIIGFFITLIFARGTIVPKKERNVLIGAWTEGFFDPDKKEIHSDALLRFEHLVHKRMSLAHYYIGWESLADPMLVKQFNEISLHNWEPVLNMNPYYFSGCPASSLPLYKAIAQGNCDAFLKKAAMNLRNIKHPFFLLFAWEMNNEQNTWSISTTGSSPHDFILAWRHMYTLFKKNKVNQITWVFCPNVPNSTTMPYKSFYPGNTYVDWIGLDGYNWGTTQSWSSWESFTNVFYGSYSDITNLAKGKPLMIAEFNTTDQGGNKAVWYTNMLTREVPYLFPKINALLIFNEDRTKQENVNWKIDSSISSLKAFSAGLQGALYRN